MMMNEVYRVTVKHKASYPYSVELRTGEKVTISDKREKGWIWCTNKEGVGAWIPEKYLSQENQTCTLLSDYNSTELTVEVGERLTFIKEECGWVLCINRQGQSGWVPSHNVRKL